MSSRTRLRPLSSVLFDPSFTSRRTPTTLENYRHALKRCAKYAAIVYPSDATPEKARRFLDVRLTTCSPASVATEYHGLLAVLDHLERAGEYPLAQLLQLRRLAPEPVRKRQLSAAFLTREQVEAAIAAAPHARAVLAIRLLTLTGLRAGEAASLCWPDVDLEGRTLFVVDGKTGPRRVPLTTAALEVLRAARPESGKGHVLGGAERRAIQHWLDTTSEAAGFRINAVLCRHTRASWWVQAGVSLAKTAAWLGHSPVVCARFYAALLDTYDVDCERGA